MKSSNYNVIGLMSGTSLDGVDIAFCRISVDENNWKYEIIQAETIEYTNAWKQNLLHLENTDALTFQQTHIDYGCYLGRLIADFVVKYDIKADLVASHGHTVFHQPEKKLTVQVGEGAAIAAECKIPVVCDFRSLDVALGGQGAPLVPIGDRLLFSEYDFCLNLGGFANISYEQSNKRIAFDICSVNIVMNAICEKIGKVYDNNGDLARSGILNIDLLNELNRLSFYQLPSDTPKSLGKEWVVENILPLIKKYQLPEIDLLHTFCEHVALQISKTFQNKNKGKLLATGGGVYNVFLMERIKEHASVELVIPDKNTIEFKEALIFAFLGVLRIRNEINCLSSVTGAQKDSCGGAVYFYE